MTFIPIITAVSGLVMAGVALYKVVKSDGKTDEKIKRSAELVKDGSKDAEEIYREVKKIKSGHKTTK